MNGHAVLVTCPQTVARYRTLAQPPWAAGPEGQFMAVSTELAEGRRARRPG